MNNSNNIIELFDSSNILDNKINSISNYVIDYISNYDLITNIDNEVSNILINKVVSTSNELINYINSYDIILNIDNEVSNIFETKISTTSNNLVNYINNLDLIANIDDTLISQLNNKINDTSNILIDKIDNINFITNIDNDSNIIRLNNNSNIVNNLIENNINRITILEDNLTDIFNSNLNISNLLDINIVNISLDKINQGLYNKYINCNIYDDDLEIEGTLKSHNTILSNNATIINESMYNSDCINIINYGINDSIHIEQIGEGNILKISNNYEDKLIINKHGFIGNKSNIEKNIDIDGDIRCTKLIGNGENITNINLNDKTTSDLIEGSNLFYTEERLYDFYKNSNLLLSNAQFTEILDNVNNIKHVMGLHQLDRVEQGTSNKYIINNVYNDDLIVLGNLKAKSIDLLEFDTDYYTDLYYSNIFINPFHDERDTYANISNILRNVIIDEPTIGNNSNLEIKIESLLSIATENYINDINKLLNDKINNLTLDDIQQGNINKFIISNIYNENLVINGNIITKDIDVNIEQDLQEHYNNEYNKGLSNIIAGDNEYLENRIKSIIDNNLSNWLIIINDTVDTKIKTISLDNVIQGDTNKFIVKNMYNDDLIVNGNIISKDLDINIDHNMSIIYSNLYINELTNHNIADSDYLKNRIAKGVEDNMSNYILNLENDRLTNNTNLSNYIININNMIMNKIDNLSLDNIYQGEKNKYIIDNIYNENLIINGNIITKDIDINIEEELFNEYNDRYNFVKLNSNINYDYKSLTLNDNYVNLSKYVTNETTTINNNIYDIQNILSQYHNDIIFSNMHIENINNLNKKIDNLIDKYSSVERILTNLGFNI